ncbi:MAG: NAD(P)H-binding protein [Hymenobacter sp.]
MAVHTLSPQPGSSAAQGFMDVELTGLHHIVAACRTHGVRRVVYVTFLGAAPEAPSAWVRERWQAEQYLLHSGLDATIIRPGQIVGPGGQELPHDGGPGPRPLRRGAGQRAAAVPQHRGGRPGVLPGGRAR